MRWEMLQAPETAHPGQSGLVELRLERRAGRTRLAHSRTRPPLLVQRALHPDEAVPDMAYVFLANPTGGLLENDRHCISVHVAGGARAHVTTQSATKIFTMEQGEAEQQVSLNVASGAYLEYLPDPLIPFRNASLTQHASINLEPGAALVMGEVITPGRVAMGESFDYRRLSIRLTVNRQDRWPVYREAVELVPGVCDPVALGVLGPARPDESRTPIGRTLGSLLVLCETEPARSMLGQLRDAVPACAQVPACDEVRLAASALPDAQGMGVKIVGTDCAAVQSAMTRVWSIARRELLGVAAPVMRKY